MTYTKIEYYENGKLKSVIIKGVFVSFKGALSDIEQEK